jgi:LysR family transcriptional regulator, low CO2-responsive transcriptional regulator
MRYVQLRAFHHVAVHGGFSKAAAALGLSQPAISDQVRRLEEEYDVTLIDRQRRSIALTPQGRKLLDITRRMFLAEEEASGLLSEAQILRKGTLRVVADSAYHVLKVLAGFRAAYPHIGVSVHAGNSEQVLQRLYRYEADVGVLGEVPRSRNLRTLRLSSEPIVAFVAREHRLARTSTVTLAELCAEPLVLREQGSKTRQNFEVQASARGLVPNIAIEAEGREAVREIVATGIGVGVVSRAEFGADPRLVALPIGDCDMRMEEALICLNERAASKLIEAFFAIAEADALSRRP